MSASSPAPHALPAALSRFADDVVVVQKPGLLEAEVDGEIVALHIDSGKCYGMNEVSSHIWLMLATPHTVGDIQAALLKRYAVDGTECREQVALLLAQLESEDLIAFGRP